MKSIFALISTVCCLFCPASSFADETAKQIAGTWKLVYWQTKFDAGVEPMSMEEVDTEVKAVRASRRQRAGGH